MEVAEKPAAQEKPSPSFRDMHLKVADVVHVDPPSQTGAGRLSARVVGWVEGERLLLTALRGPSGTLDLREGELVVVRAFTGRRAYAFRCSVIKRSGPPYEFLHLSFPTPMQAIEVRNAPRCRVDLSCVATVAGQRHDIRLRDISESGAMVKCDAPLGPVGTQVELALEVEIHEVPVKLALKCEIRSDKPPAAGDRHRHGVSFTDLQPSDRLALAALVFHRLYENPGAMV